MTEVERWFHNKAEGLRYKYPLNQDSIVLDLGVYKGHFSKKIFNFYRCKIYGFEPIKKFYEESVLSLKYYTNISIYNYGIGSSNRLENIAVQEDSSSIYNKNNNQEEIQIRSILEVLEELNLNRIDLIKINVEGSEYEILETILDNNIVSLFNNIQVQFHDFIPNAIERRNSIRNRLALTHDITYNYDFVWENHRLRNS